MVGSISGGVGERIVSSSASGGVGRCLRCGARERNTTTNCVSNCGMTNGANAARGENMAGIRDSFSRSCVSSFYNCTPTSSPRVTVLMFFSAPSNSTCCNSRISSPMFVGVVDRILPCLSIGASCASRRLNCISTSTNSCAKIDISRTGATIRTSNFATAMGNGNSAMVSRVPAMSSKLRGNNDVILCASDSDRSRAMDIPDLVNLSPSRIGSITDTCKLGIDFSNTAASSKADSSRGIRTKASIDPNAMVAMSFTSSSSALGRWRGCLLI